MNSAADSRFALWDANVVLEANDPTIVGLSRGFFQLRLDSWLPTIKSHWQHFFDTLGCEVKILDVIAQPHKKPEAEARAYALDIDGEHAVLHISEALLQLSLETIWPASRRAGREVLLHYLMLRLAGSINNAWAGSEKSVVKASHDSSYLTEHSFAYIKIICSINALKTELYFGLSQRLVERLDKAWRRQIHGMTRDSIISGDVTLSLPELNIAHEDLTDYLAPGVIIDLETPSSAHVDILLNKQRWGSGALSRVDDNFCLEVISTQNVSSNERISTAPKANRDILRFQFGSFRIEPQLAAELSQEHALYDTEIPLGNRLTITANHKPVGTAELGEYQGRFAVRVL